MSLKKQTIINSLGSACLLGSQWLISVLLVRLSGYEDAGVFALAMSIANVFSTFANYGLRNYQVTDINFKYLPNQYIWDRLILSSLSFLFCCMYLWFDGYSARNASAILLYLLYNLFVVISDIIMGNLQLANHLEINGFSNALRGCLCFLLFLAVQLLSRHLLWAMCAMSLGSLIVLLIFDLPKYRQYCTNRGSFSWQSVRMGLSLLSICFFVFVSTIIPIVITAVPRREIQRQMGEAALGIFSAVYTPAVILNTIIPTILLALVPRIAKFWKANELDTLRKEVAKSYGLVLFGTMIALFFSAVAGKLFLRLIYGSDILAFFPLLYASVAAIGLNCACVCGNYILVAFDRKGSLALFSGVSLLCVLLLTSSMVFKFGLYGAAWILIVAYTAQVLLQLALIVIEMRKKASK